MANYNDEDFKMNPDFELGQQTDDRLIESPAAEGGFDIASSVLKRFPFVKEEATQDIYNEGKALLPEMDGEPVLDLVEKMVYEKPKMPEASLRNPADAPIIEKAITTAKAKGIEPGRGIVSMIVEGLLVATGGGAVSDVSAVFDREAAQQLAAKKELRTQTQFEREEAAYAKTKSYEDAMEDPASSASNNIRMAGKVLFEKGGMAKMSGQLDAMSGIQISRMLARFDPVISQQLITQGKLEYERESPKIAAAKAKTAAAAEAKLTAAEAKAKGAMELKKYEASEKVALEGEKGLIKQHNEDREQSKKFKPTIRTVDRIIELGEDVETGQLVGMSPVVSIRKLFDVFGGDKLQELESLIIGLPLPVLKATFGAAFSVSEGEKLAESLANIKMDAVAFKNAMTKMKDKLQYDEDVFQEKDDWFREKRSLMDFQSTIDMPVSGGETTATLKANEVRKRMPDGKIVVFDKNTKKQLRVE